jgi:hypothetical protein
MSNNNAKVLYLLENQSVDLVLSSDTIRVDNKPMNQTSIVVQKGFTNTVNFFIRNRDRVLQDVSNETLYITVIDPNTQTRILFKQLTHVTNSVGEVRLDLSTGDLNDLRPGFYKMAISKSADAGQTQYALYANQNEGVITQFEIKSPLEYHPLPSQSIESFIQTGNVVLGDPSDKFVTSAMYGNQAKNYRHSRHTIGFYLDEFVGTIQIQGSALESVPTQESDWYNINPQGDFGQSIIPYTSAFTGIDPFNFVINTNWIRVEFVKTSGSVDKILLRN